MLSDELTSFFKTHSLIAPTFGTGLTRTGDGRFQVLLFNTQKRVHVSESADTAVEAIGKMITRVMGGSETSSARDTDIYAALEIALAGFTSSISDNLAAQDDL